MLHAEVSKLNTNRQATLWPGRKGRRSRKIDYRAPRLRPGESSRDFRPRFALQAALLTANFVRRYIR